MVTSGRGGRGKICRKRWRATKQIHFEELVVVVVGGGEYEKGGGNGGCGEASGRSRKGMTWIIKEQTCRHERIYGAKRVI